MSFPLPRPREPAPVMRGAERAAAYTWRPGVLQGPRRGRRIVRTSPENRLLGRGSSRKDRHGTERCRRHGSPFFARPARGRQREADRDPLGLHPARSGRRRRRCRAGGGRAAVSRSHPRRLGLCPVAFAGGPFPGRRCLGADRTVCGARGGRRSCLSRGQPRLPAGKHRSIPRSASSVSRGATARVSHASSADCRSMRSKAPSFAAATAGRGSSAFGWPVSRRRCTSRLAPNATSRCCTFRLCRDLKSPAERVEARMKLVAVTPPQASRCAPP